MTWFLAETMFHSKALSLYSSPCLRQHYLYIVIFWISYITSRFAYTAFVNLFMIIFESMSKGKKPMNFAIIIVYTLHSIFILFMWCFLLPFFRHELKQNPWIQMKATTIQKAYQPATIGRNLRQKQSKFTKWKINYFLFDLCVTSSTSLLHTFPFRAFFLLHLFFAAQFKYFLF